MFRFIMPTILIVISGAIFFTFTSPFYQEVISSRDNVASYNEALSNSKALENERDKLTQKYNSIGGENLNRLQKLLPETVDNIRLILEIEKLALPYGMVLSDVQYESGGEDATSASPGIIPPELKNTSSNKDYNVWTLGFSTEGSYDNFIQFIEDIESNLRIVDIDSVSFSSESTKPNIYKYDFSIKTYWLKN